MGARTSKFWEYQGVPVGLWFATWGVAVLYGTSLQWATIFAGEDPSSGWWALLILSGLAFFGLIMIIELIYARGVKDGLAKAQKAVIK